MTKAEVVKRVAKCAGVSERIANECIDCYLELIYSELRKGEKFGLTKIGKLSVAHRTARVGRNPQTGERIEISAKKVVKFKASRSIKIR